MIAGTRKSQTFSTTTTNRDLTPITNRVVISLGTTSKTAFSLNKTLLLVSTPKDNNLPNNNLLLLPLLLKSAALMPCYNKS
ncbi:hypothetical protein F2Q70_00025390 [Brassica cretica]|uniref:Uncharacterized protein n=1 Tax=Brassica cretica TaxID=69181 RepID=A0A8S9LAZ1_BRACR|nr:hypothetical protein F2Q70_00025390 [Brassica cretica]